VCLLLPGLDLLLPVLPACQAQVFTQTALLEYRHGSQERGRGIFEEVLRTYPKRLDIWNTYLDQVRTVLYFEWYNSEYSSVLYCHHCW